MQNWTQTLLSQYASAPTITGIIENFNDCLDPQADLQNFYNFVWDLDTAQGFGLDIWGRILGLTRNLDVNGVAYTLDDTTYRSMLYIKALSNISATNAASLNKLLTQLFSSEGRAYAIDMGHMRMMYVFEFALSALDYTILSNSNLLPHPAGVMYEVVQVINGHPAFGLDYETNYLAGLDAGYLV